MIFHTQIESGVWIPIQDSLEPQIRDKYYQDRNESLKTMYIPYVYILLQIYYYIYVIIIFDKHPALLRQTPV